MNIPFNRVNGGLLAISVPDLEASSNWYAEDLGLKPVKQATSADNKAAVTILQGNGLSPGAA